jgi:hypothetical protein
MKNRRISTSIIVLLIFFTTGFQALAGTGDPQPRKAIVVFIAPSLMTDTTPGVTKTAPTTQPVADTKGVTDVIKEVPKARSHPKPIPVTAGPLIKTAPIVPKVIKPIIRIH